MFEDPGNLVLYHRDQNVSLNREANRLLADLAQMSPGYRQTIRIRWHCQGLSWVIRLKWPPAASEPYMARRRRLGLSALGLAGPDHSGQELAYHSEQAEGRGCR